MSTARWTNWLTPREPCEERKNLLMCKIKKDVQMAIDVYQVLIIIGEK
jgi:hypothetical protein